jgi:hypothetical protein
VPRGRDRGPHRSRRQPFPGARDLRIAATRSAPPRPARPPLRTARAARAGRQSQGRRRFAEVAAAQDLLSRDIGAAPIRGSEHIGPDDRGDTGTFHPGEILVLTLGSQPHTAARTLDRLLTALARQGLVAVSFSNLLASASGEGPRAHVDRRARRAQPTGVSGAHSRSCCDSGTDAASSAACGRFGIQNPPGSGWCAGTSVVQPLVGRPRPRRRR